MYNVYSSSYLILHPFPHPFPKKVSGHPSNALPSPPHHLAPIAALSSGAFEPLLFDARGIWRHFDLGILEAVDAFDDPIAPAIPGERHSRATRAMAGTPTFMAGASPRMDQHQP